MAHPFRPDTRLAERQSAEKRTETRRKGKVMASSADRLLERTRTGAAAHTGTAAALAALLGGSGAWLQAQAPVLPCGTEMRILVLSADGIEAALPAITQTLHYLGTPYTTYIASKRRGGLTADFLGVG